MVDITQKINIKLPPYRMQWQGVHFITDDIPDDLRYDALLTSKELFNIDYTVIFNEFKLVKMKNYLKRKLSPVSQSIDPTHLSYNGWEITLHEYYENEFGKKVRPFNEGFVIAKKEIIAGLWIVSIAITLKAH